MATDTSLARARKAVEGVIFGDRIHHVSIHTSTITKLIEACATLLDTVAAEARAGAWEEAAQMIPTNWLDPLLSGPSTQLMGTAGRWGCPDVENLLRTIAAALRERSKP